jgi:hypothetical protein
MNQKPTFFKYYTRDDEEKGALDDSLTLVAGL